MAGEKKKGAVVTWDTGPEKFMGTLSEALLIFRHNSGGITVYGVGDKASQAFLIASLIDDLSDDPELGGMVTDLLQSGVFENTVKDKRSH